MKWHQHRVAIVSGLRDTRLTTGEDYATATLPSLFSLAPTTKAKNDAAAIIPSLYADHDARQHAAQEGRGRFVALCGDIDHGNHDLATIEHAVAGFAAGAAWLIYSTASAKADDQRWRVIVPLDQALPFQHWLDLQVVFAEQMVEAGVEVDAALQRAGQIAFLPNVPRDLRNAAGIPLFYQTATSGIDAPGLRLDGGSIVDAIDRLRQRRAEEEQRAARKLAEAGRRRSRSAVGMSLIDAFNEVNPLTGLLPLYGYEEDPRHPGNWRSPLQESGSYATRIMDGGKWFSLSGSDGAAGLGGECLKHGARYGDAFDLFAHYEHHGDRTEALRAIRREATDHKANPND